jgi:hypothetical protein
VINRLLKKIIPRRFRPSYRARRIVEQSAGACVYSGPFGGMVFASPESPAKYLLGTYELELAPWVAQLCRISFDTIIDVGAEMGYYAVGLARLWPAARIVAFEADEKFHPSIRDMARVNGVAGRLTVCGSCEPHLLSAAIEGSACCLIVMDCEGGEKGLLDPRAIPTLEKCHILVELHEFIFRDIAAIVSARFNQTHEISEVWSRTRTSADFPIPLPRSFQHRLLQKYFVSSMNEGRPERMRWFYLKPGRVERGAEVKGQREAQS